MLYPRCRDGNDSLPNEVEGVKLRACKQSFLIAVFLPLCFAMRCQGNKHYFINRSCGKDMLHTPRAPMLVQYEIDTI